MQLWSERPPARIREVAADLATLAWLAFWGQLGIGIYAFLANAAAAGRLIRDSGSGLDGAGETLGGALQGIPLIGEGSATGVRGAFSSAANPLIRFGIDLERLLIVIAALFGLLVVAVAVIPWLNRYLPWRVARWRRLNAASRVIRRPRQSVGRPLSAPALQRILASRALHRLEYDELLEFSPDPFGDWDAGRHDRLAEAELDRVGLQAVGRAAGA